MKKTFIIANWKCNPTTLKKTKTLFDSIKKQSNKTKKGNNEIVICPPLVYLPTINAKPTNIKLGAQNCYWEENGAFTGETSPLMLKDLKCKYVFVGHSERRKYFNETDEKINKKIEAIIKAKMIPILCVGETKEEKKQEKTQQILKTQLKIALKGVKLKNTKLCIAYEPVWALGTGKACNPDEAKKINLLIKKIITQLYNPSIAKKLPVLYGGSVNSKNANAFIKEACMDGLLIGGASLDAREFSKIISSI